jgi:phospholipid transport system substrate-binding protein
MSSALRLVFLALLGIVGLVSTPRLALAEDAVAATAPQMASDFIQNLGDRAVAILADKALAPENKDQIFQGLMRASFDLVTIGRFVIGRNAWMGASEEERSEYLALFEKLVIGIYSDRFALYNGETFKVVDSRSEGERDFIVTSQLQHLKKDKPIIIDWRVRNIDGRLGIIDVIVEGISMSVSQRQEYASVLSQKDNQISALLTVMRNKLESNKAQAGAKKG